MKAQEQPWDHPEPHTLPTRIGAADMDGLNHTNNAVYVKWCERVAWSHSVALGLDLATYQAELGNWDRVARARRALLALDPVDRAEAHYQLAYAYERTGDRSSAREQILYALEIAPNFYRAQELLLSLRATTPAGTDTQ